MVGIASQKENSVAARLSAPNSMAPTIVAPERDTPGIMERHWTKPIPRYIGKCEFGGIMIARLQIKPVDPQQHETANDKRGAHYPHIEQVNS